MSARPSLKAVNLEGYDAVAGFKAHKLVDGKMHLLTEASTTQCLLSTKHQLIPTQWPADGSGVKTPDNWLSLEREIGITSTLANACFGRYNHLAQKYPEVARWKK